jgi:hypothetical protein
LLAKKKKEEFPDIMENMLSGNSFPQICVVSGNKYVENGQYCTRVRKECV